MTKLCRENLRARITTVIFLCLETLLVAKNKKEYNRSSDIVECIAADRILEIVEVTSNDIHKYDVLIVRNSSSVDNPVSLKTFIKDETADSIQSSSSCQQSKQDHFMDSLDIDYDSLGYFIYTRLKKIEKTSHTYCLSNAGAGMIINQLIHTRDKNGPGSSIKEHR